MRNILLVLALIVTTVLPAGAATLSAVQGQVLVNTGNGFRNAQPGQTINPGDRVLVQPGASAQVSYADGSILNVPSGGVYTIPTTPPVAPPPAAGGFPPGVLIAGGVVAAAGAGILIYQATKSSSP